MIVSAPFDQLRTETLPGSSIGHNDTTEGQDFARPFSRALDTLSVPFAIKRFPGDERRLN